MKDYNEIDDIFVMVDLMKALHIPGKGLSELEKMKVRVRDELESRDETPSSNAEEAFQSTLLKAKEEEATKKRGLLNFYDKVDGLLDKLPKEDFSLQQEIMKVHMDQLREEENKFLLVTGETSSGKSSLVNLMLGKEILPSFSVVTTSNICELKYGEKPEIVAHFKDKDPETGEKQRTVPLEEPTGSSETSYLEQISPYVDKRDCNLKKVELKWPHPFLKNGIVIVDSPGIGASDEMDEIVEQYLPKAFACIYVINSTNAGGICKYGLEAWFQKSCQASVDVSEKEQENDSLDVLKILQSKCALFVCNKWDDVKGSEDVKKVVKEKLKRAWPGFDPGSQIIYMSVKEALLAQEYGLNTDEFSSLMNGMRSFVLNAIGPKLGIHWRWLYDLLKRIILQSNLFTKNLEEVKQKMEKALVLLNKIENRKDQVIKDLQKDLDGHINDVVTQLSKYLSSDATKSRFISWNPKELPPAETSWKETEDNINSLLSKRFNEFIEKWEKDNMVFKNANESFLQHIQQHFTSFVDKLVELQRNVTKNDPQDPHKYISWVISPISGTVATVCGIALKWAVTASSVVVLLAKKGSDLYNLQKYKEDRKAVMAEKSASFLADAAQTNKVKKLVEEILRGLKENLAQIKAHLPQLMKADKKLYEDLQAEERSHDALCQVYQPIKDKVSKLIEQLVVFGMKNVFNDPIKSEELIWKEENSSRLGSGAFGAVYEGQMGSHEKVKVPVTLKVYKDEFFASNAIKVMDEVQYLRKLSHPSIVKFYGTSLIGDEDNAKVILVGEKCKGDFKNHISDNVLFVSGGCRLSTVVKETYQWVKEITDALAFMHGVGMIHGDLKLESILLSEMNSVRINVVGLPKGTSTEIPVYMAPEVFRTKLPDSKADIYSLGIILWEMWYGPPAFSFDESLTPQEFFRRVEKGERPVPRKDCKKPPPIWQDMMTRCWDGDPEKRPTAKKCNEDIAILCAD